MKATPEKIIEAASTMFRAQGFKGASLNDISHKAKLSKGALFHYYRDKNEIANDVLAQYVQSELFTLLDQSLQTDQPVKISLMGFIGAVYERLLKDEFQGGCLLGNWALELSDTNEPLRAEIAQYFLELENRLVGFLRPMAKEGKVLMEPRQFARIFIAALEGTIMLCKAHKDKNRAGREFQALAEMVEWMIKD